ncbi:hypothetical protein VSS37_04085 [Candidatus Thiothrix sp. Deng01]|uniref:Glucosamine inositolphosphorylceramide transferase 1 N-terminal domain-containing protein n=1 Tax=Candidatus Thiothrix phosphatis TaxID=3112415 RepID=A0ABU6CU73_9GAMM|nr:hypothetical protein [Candidatus Thiothrix sp. Deng01]MEB4590151.1 hypothetical protein [Candidatus Thiothrix sp. Deng01]
MSANLFRIVLIVDGEYISAWQSLMLERLQASGGGVLVAVIFRQPLASGIEKKINFFLFRVLHFLDGKIFKAPVNAQKPVSFLDQLGDVFFCAANSRRYQKLLKEQTLDVAIDLTGQEPLSAVIASVRYGVWRYFHGYPAAMMDCYVGIREYANREDEIISGVERSLPSQSVPERIFYATTSTDMVSINRGIESTLWKMADFIPQRLSELAQVGESLFFQNASARLRQFPFAQQYASSPPGLLMTLRVLWRYLSNFIRKLYNSLFRNEQWILLTSEAGDASSLCMLGHFRKLIPSRDRFWADPFVVEHEGEQYVFFEELVYANGVGHLACIRLNADGSYSDPVTILEKPYHLSYPFIFKYQGQYYLIPETAENHTIEVYRCEAFPYRWVFEKNLMENVEAYDSTLLEHAGRWWMFVSMRNHQSCSPSEALYLFYADNPLSTQWHAHPQNPVVARASHARPGGGIFEEGGRLYRPSQNCAGVYGRGLNINLIRQLDTSTYREETVSRYVPDGANDMNGVHTLGLGEKISVSDAVHIHRRLGMLDRWVVKLSSFFNYAGHRQILVVVAIPLAWLWFHI